MRTLHPDESDPLVSYIEQLLHALPEPQRQAQIVRRSTIGRSNALVEPLSERELEVLRLLAAGLESPEIARELLISVSTARTHIKNIYGKLGVHGRVQAIERARTWLGTAVAVDRACWWPGRAPRSAWRVRLSPKISPRVL